MTVKMNSKELNSLVSSTYALLDYYVKYIMIYFLKLCKIPQTFQDTLTNSLIFPIMMLRLSKKILLLAGILKCENMREKPQNFQ